MLVAASGVSSAEQSLRTLCAEGIPLEVDDNVLRRIFSPTRALVSVRVYRTNLDQQTALLEFASYQAAQEALQEYNGRQVLESQLRLKWASVVSSSTAARHTEGLEVGPESHSLYVGDLSPDVTDKQLQQHFKTYFSSVSSAKVICDRSTGRSKGYGFVRFDTEAQRDQALRVMEGEKIGNQAIRVSQAKAKRYQGDGLFHPSDFDPGNTTAFVGNVNADVTEDDLRQVFCRCGEIASVKVLRAKGCAFVTYANRASAERAIVELHGKVIKNSAIRLCWGRRSAPRQRESTPNIDTDLIGLTSDRQPGFGTALNPGLQQSFYLGSLAASLEGLPGYMVPPALLLRGLPQPPPMVPQHLPAPLFGPFPNEYPVESAFSGQQHLHQGISNFDVDRSAPIIGGVDTSPILPQPINATALPSAAMMYSRQSRRAFCEGFPALD